MTVHALPASAGTKALSERDEPTSVVTLAVENMRCGGCIRSVERAAMSVPGVKSARANLAAKRVSVVLGEGRAGEADVIAALGQAGFAAAPMQAAKQGAETTRETELLRRVAVSGFAAMNIMLLSVSVWAGRAGDMDQSLVTLFCWLSALIALPTVVYAGQPFYASALSALKGRRLNMDVPISLAIILATAMSLYQTVRGNDQVYFDAAVSLLFFLLIGRYLDEHLRVRARGEAQNLLSLQSGIATLIGEDGVFAAGSSPCACARRQSAHRRRRAHSGRRSGPLRIWRDRPEPDHRRDDAGGDSARRAGLCRHAQSRQRAQRSK